MIEVNSSSPEETEEIAAALARELRPGDVVGVEGELGSGKTTFIRGACRALGVEGPVTSPSYTIGHRYRGSVDISHLDLYRFAGVSDSDWGDLEEYFRDAVVFIEWPENAAGRLPSERVRVGLRHLGERHRLIVLSALEKSLENSIFTGDRPSV